jgi:plasmid maintenance system antidote protein VapI
MTRIKECLARIGQTQKWLAVTMGVKQPSVHDWITGKNTPSTENLKRLSELFGVSSDYLLGISDDMGKEEATKEETSNLVPKTLEARIVSFGMDKLPQEERQKILDILQRMYDNNPDIFKEEQAQ